MPKITNNFLFKSIMDKYENFRKFKRLRNLKRLSNNTKLNKLSKITKLNRVNKIAKFNRVSKTTKLNMVSKITNFNFSMFLISAFKKFLINFKNINFFKRHIAYKRLAIALTSVMLLVTAVAFASMTGHTSDISDTSVDIQEFKEPILAYMVSLDGQDLGVILDADGIEVIVEELKSELAKLYDMDVKMTNDIIISEQIVESSDIKNSRDLKEVISKYGEFKVSIKALLVDGNEIGLLKTEEEISDILEQLKMPYLIDDEEEAKLIDEIHFLEEIKIESKDVYFTEVQDAGEVLNMLSQSFTSEEDYIVSEGDTLWSIRNKFDISEDSINKLNPQLNDTKYLQIGQKLRIDYPQYFLNVVAVEIINYTQSIPFQTERTKDSTLYTNQSKVTRYGKNGLKDIEAKVFKLNGIEQRREIISEKITKDPVNQVVADGTKKIPLSISRGGGAILWPTAGVISSPFGRRWGTLHTGIDIANKTGTPIYAAEAGRVTFSGYSGGYGNLIKIDHGGGMETYYAHLQTRLAKVGDNVAKGKLIGYMGNTGRSTGPHLHFEIRLNNQPLDPMRYLN